MKNKFPKISVVILNYNGLKYLKRTLLSVLKLDYPNYEVVIVDNGSNDQSIDFINQFKNVKLIQNSQNLGYSKGKNIGVKNANGEYIFLLDNDILITRRDILKKLLDLNNRIKNVGFISIPLFDEGNLSTIRYGCFYSGYGQAMNRPLTLQSLKKLPNYYKSPAPIGGNIFFNKKLWSKMRGYDEKFMFHLDDYDIGARSVIYGYDNYILNITPLLHIGNELRINNSSWCWKYRFQLCSFSTIIIKNYKTANLIGILTLSHLFLVLKTIKNMIFRRSLCPLISHIYSYYLFFKNLKYALDERKIIQSKRIIKEDIFLKIKPPRLN